MILQLRLRLPSPFQSTHSRGVRRMRGMLKGKLASVSIHALARSATVLDPPYITMSRVSIHALARSATSVLLAVPVISMMFQIHALARSATRHCGFAEQA